jgi:Domain of unknown function (DUF4352)
MADCSDGCVPARTYNQPPMRRAPPRLVITAVLIVLGLLVYGYFTQPLPLGLSSVVRNPGATSGASGGSVPPTARAGAGQPLTLGAVTVAIDSVDRNQDLSTGATHGPPGAFTLVQLHIQNGGSASLTLQPTDFELVDDRARAYAVDVEATRAAAQVGRRRYPFEATVPPGSRLSTVLAFEPGADSSNLALRATLGYGEVALP